MKKRNVCASSRNSSIVNLLVAPLVLCALFFASCRSTPVGADVHPLDLLDGGGAFYLKLPRECDSGLVERIVLNAVPELGEEGARMIVQRIDTVYAGIARSRTENAVQIAASGLVPRRSASSALKRAGWQTENFSPEASGRRYEYYTAPDSIVQLAFPSGNLACVAKDVSTMLEDYDRHAFAGDVSHKLENEVYDWLNGGGGDIRFYAPNPLSFLTILTGAALNLQLNYVKGSVTVDENSDEYVLAIEFDFNNRMVAVAGSAMLSLAFSLTDSQVTQNSPTNITISGIRIAKEQFYQLFAL